MKKAISGLSVVITVICIAFSFVGCGERPDEDRTEPDGRLCTFINAYNEGWIDVDDLKSIACGYYEWQSIEDNPYSGLYEAPAKQLSKETENKIKRAYFDQSEEIKILKYYGTYEGNVVVTLGYDDFDYDGAEKSEVTVGGVDFHKIKHRIDVYHYFEKADPTIKITGRLFGIRTAFENGLIGENDLKSIASGVNDSDSGMENRMCEAPVQKLDKNTKKELKQAFLEQVYDDAVYTLLDGIKINKYYGIYNGHMVVSITGDRCGLGAANDGTEIGGVTFNNSDWRSIYVYYKFN